MSKNWSLFCVVIFALGFGLKSYWDTQPTQQHSTSETLVSTEHPLIKHLFDTHDPRIRVVYFGFTRCPDVCPTSLAMLSGALHHFNEPTLQQLRPIFISLDPERDTPQDTKTYAAYFHPQIEGMALPFDLTRLLAERYGVIFQKTNLPNSELKYTLDHSSYFYFLKPDGTLITQVPHTNTPAPIVAAMKEIITTEGK
ncbi:SCO family protein [Vibrio cincinnatiensis]|uniref:SCO family protein n=1 Tax=Vibrio cincinnatiensis TaxID=675 RepID=UPI001302AA8C|nr:SCO family protein [Vibrio cincinnatiensis]